MGEPQTPTPGESWKRVATSTGRYEFQFQGRTPTVRNGQYQDANDFQFLVLDEDGWLYRIPVRVPASVANAEAALVAEARLRAGLERFRPRQNAPYEELDEFFGVKNESEGK